MKKLWMYPRSPHSTDGLRTKERRQCDNSTPCKDGQVESRSEIRKDFSGIVEAVDYVKLAFRVSGQIINLPVVEGQRVKKDN